MEVCWLLCGPQEHMSLKTLELKRSRKEALTDVVQPGPSSCSLEDAQDVRSK